jgi:hypothetical protein
MIRHTLPRLWITLLLLAVFGWPASAQDNGGIDPEALIERILMIHSEQQATVSDVTFDATYIEGKMEDKKGFVESERFDKKIYIKYLPDTAWYHEEFLAYFKDGERQEEKELQKAAAERIEKKEKRKAYDISYPMLKPFFADQRQFYDIRYDGMAAEVIEDQVCHKFTVTAREKLEGMIEGVYYFEAESFHLLRVDFRPAKLVKKTMFKLNQLDMSMLYGQTLDGLWLPQRFEVNGKGKAALFIGVSFAGREYYRNAVVNSDLPDSLFQKEADNE